MPPLASRSRSTLGFSSQQGGSARARSGMSGRGALEAFVPGYWLSRCEGFRVDDRDGPLGFVESVVMDDPRRDPRALIVTENRPGGRRHYVPVLDVAAVQCVAERVALDTSSRTGREPSPADGRAALHKPATTGGFTPARRDGPAREKETA